jgi:hypothetical protein
MRYTKWLVYNAILMLTLLFSGGAFAQYIVVDSCDDYEDYNCECYDSPYYYCVYYPDASYYPSNDFYVDFGVPYYGDGHHHFHREQGSSFQHSAPRGGGSHGWSNTRSSSFHSAVRIGGGGSHGGHGGGSHGHSGGGGKHH